jgi:NarL family two-component system response regulator LiaR
MTEIKPIRVMLVDDHAVVRSGLSAFLLAYDDLELVGAKPPGESAPCSFASKPSRMWCSWI